MSRRVTPRFSVLPATCTHLFLLWATVLSMAGCDSSRTQEPAAHSASAPSVPSASGVPAPNTSQALTRAEENTETVQQLQPQLHPPSEPQTIQTGGSPTLQAAEVDGEATLPFEPARPGTGCGPKPLQARNIVLVTIDALRADRVSWMGYGRRTTPHMDELASDAVIYQQAYAHGSETRTSMASLLAGQFPPSPSWNALPSSPTLLERARSAGYQVVALVSNTWLNAAAGYDRGTHTFRLFSYFYPPDTNTGRKDGRALIQQALSTLEAGRRPTLVWLHLMDVHNPYRAPGPIPYSGAAQTDRYVNGPKPSSTSTRELQWLSDRYDEGILYTDGLLDPLFRWARGSVGGRQSLVVVTSDHGESFGENGMLGHGTGLTRELVQVPLLVRFPGRWHGGTQVQLPVGLSSVADMVAAFTPGGASAQKPGSPLCRALEIQPAKELEASALEWVVPMATKSLFDGKIHRAIVAGPWQLVERPGPQYSLYRVNTRTADPTDYSAREPALVEKLKRQLNDRVGATAAPEALTPLTADQRRALESIGYVGKHDAAR